MIKNGATKIPELVLAITWDKRPQRLQIAGYSRLDRLFSKEVTPISMQCGHGVIRFNVEIHGRSQASAWNDLLKMRSVQDYESFFRH
jgi:hypothetical protein